MSHAADENGAGPQRPVRYLSVAEAATLATLGLRTVRRHIAAGRLRSYKVGARRLVAVADLEAWIRAGTEAEYPR